MLNLLGASSSMGEIKKVVAASLDISGATTHLYGKAESRPGRKMGHITLVAESDAELEANLRPLLEALPQFKHYYPEPLPSITPREGGFSHPQPLVSIIMGSTSDLPVMKAASKILSLPGFAIPHELSIVSAHRTPDRMYEHAKNAAEHGIRVIIAGAGGAAHLPGMIAALTCLPVIGVPVKGSTLDGVDSLHSIVQMPVSFIRASMTGISDTSSSPAWYPCSNSCHQQLDKRCFACYPYIGCFKCTTAEGCVRISRSSQRRGLDEGGEVRRSRMGTVQGLIAMNKSITIYSSSGLH